MQELYRGCYMLTVKLLLYVTASTDYNDVEEKLKCGRLYKRVFAVFLRAPEQLLQIKLLFLQFRNIHGALKRLKQMEKTQQPGSDEF